jgi:hypothetical protein
VDWSSGLDARVNTRAVEFAEGAGGRVEEVCCVCGWRVGFFQELRWMRGGFVG